MATLSRSQCQSVLCLLAEGLPFSMRRNVDVVFVQLLLHMQDVTYRKVLHDDNKGRQKVEVEQLAGWKFLMFSGSFATRLFVFQDRHQRTVGAERQPPLLKPHSPVFIPFQR